MRPRRIDVHIEELVLHGFPALDRTAFERAVERELAGICATIPTGRLESADALDAGRFDASPDPAVLGVGLARQVGKALG